jgi:hypothetical protein
MRSDMSNGLGLGPCRKLAFAKQPTSILSAVKRDACYSQNQNVTRHKLQFTTDVRVQLQNNFVVTLWDSLAFTQRLRYNFKSLLQAFEMKSSS